MTIEQILVLNINYNSINETGIDHNCALITNDLKDPLYVMSLIPKQNIKFRDMIFMFDIMLTAVITNYGSILFYQKLSKIPICINHNENNMHTKALDIEWETINTNNVLLYFFCF